MPSLCVSGMREIADGSRHTDSSLYIKTLFDQQLHEHRQRAVGNKFIDDSSKTRHHLKTPDQMLWSHSLGFFVKEIICDSAEWSESSS